jgi:WD40 repeat protein
MPGERELGVKTMWLEVGKMGGHDGEVLTMASTALCNVEEGERKKVRKFAERAGPAGGAWARRVFTRTSTNAPPRSPSSQPVLLSANKSRDEKTSGIRVWDVATNVCTAILGGGHKSSVCCLAFNDSGTVVASSGKDRRLCLWSLPAAGEAAGEPALLARVEGAHKRIVWCLDWCRGESSRKFLATGSRDGKVKIWDTSTSPPQAVQVIDVGEPVTALAFGFKPFPNLLALGTESGVVSVLEVSDDFKAHTVKVAKMPRGHRKTVNKVAFRPGQEKPQLASCGDDHGVRIWSLE